MNQAGKNYRCGDRAKCWRHLSITTSMNEWIDQPSDNSINEVPKTGSNFGNEDS